MAMIVLLAFIGMGSSVIIAETTRGVATAVNQAGSLRMQSFRIATGLASLDLATQPGYPRAPLSLIAEFESRLNSRRLTDAIPSDPDHDLRRAYDRVARQWFGYISPLVRYQVSTLQTPGDAPPPPFPSALNAGYLQLADVFVGNIDDLVLLLEEYAEDKIEKLRLIQAVCLFLTVLIVAVSLILIQRQLLLPMRDLLVCAERARHGDFSCRSHYVADDELGRLGRGFNVMAEDLSKSYSDLEQRVRQKTEDLARKNHSLELLYTIGRQVNLAPITEQSLIGIIQDIQTKLSLGPGTICLRDPAHEETGQRFASTRTDQRAARDYCWSEGCRACLNDATKMDDFIDKAGEPVRRMCFPIRERDRHFGVLILDIPGNRTLEDWQRQVLETVAGHIGSAINNNNRSRETRRLALHEERGVIARELHDSLAQSLSYLKIQISRLDSHLPKQAGNDQARAILCELREGVTSAYRQLRELLTTFRLKMDGRGLNKALVDTVQEFCHRSTVDITLDNRLPHALLTPNEEIHVLQIIREALSNVVRHAHANTARISLVSHGEKVEVAVDDDGCGIGSTDPDVQHYGMTIMRERAMSLNGSIRLENRPERGTRTVLEFTKSATQPESELTHAQ